MNKNFLSIIALTSAISLRGMDGDGRELAKPASMSPVIPTMDVMAKVDAWKAISASARDNMSYILVALAQEYNNNTPEVPLTTTKDNDSEYGEFNAVATRAWRDLRHAVRDHGAQVPLTEDAYQGYLKLSIAWARANPGCTIDDISNISATTEDPDDWQTEDEENEDVVGEERRQELVLAQFKEIASSAALSQVQEEDESEEDKQTRLMLVGILERMNAFVIRK